MQIKISARHGHLDPETQQFIRDKAEKLTTLFNRLTSIEVVVDREHDLQTVEFNVSAEHKHDFVAKEKQADLRTAVDLALDKLDAQLRKYKERIQD
ncbi:MAG TPA: ribosome-associated translation inhibitor RaiA, partial [Gemmatales bacterium]|nr:ribosome-associated translation inhibitor RaiA [Gemmatales bacterium]